MHYIDEGSGEPILFVHGSAVWSFLYRELIRRHHQPPYPAIFARSRASSSGLAAPRVCAISSASAR